MIDNGSFNTSEYSAVQHKFYKQRNPVIFLTDSIDDDVSNICGNDNGVYDAALCGFLRETERERLTYIWTRGERKFQEWKSPVPSPRSRTTGGEEPASREDAYRETRAIINVCLTSAESRYVLPTVSR